MGKCMVKYAASEVFDYGLKQNQGFLEGRKLLMAAKIRECYEGS